MFVIFRGKYTVIISYSRYFCKITINCKENMCYEKEVVKVNMTHEPILLSTCKKVLALVFLSAFSGLSMISIL